MATITLQYDGRNTALKQLIQLFQTLGGRVVEEKEPEYDPAFVEKINRSRKSKGKKIALDDLWK